MAKQRRSAQFWECQILTDISGQPIDVIGCRGDRSYRDVVPKRPYETTALRCVKLQKIVSFLYTSAEP